MHKRYKFVRKERLSSVRVNITTSDGVEYSTFEYEYLHLKYEYEYLVINEDRVRVQTKKLEYEYEYRVLRQKKMWKLLNFASN